MKRCLWLGTKIKICHRLTLNVRVKTGNAGAGWGYKPHHLISIEGLGRVVLPQAQGHSGMLCRPNF